MYGLESNGFRTEFDGNDIYYLGEKIAEQDLIERKQLDLLKFKYVFNGNFFAAYIIDEIEQYLKENEQDYKYFSFMFHVISEITIIRNVTVNVATLINYMMKDIISFKRHYENASSLSSFISEVMLEIEMIL